jgi:hypothetical protein
MATWKIEAEDQPGLFWTVEASDDIPEKEVLDFAYEQSPSWTPGGHYRIEEDTPTRESMTTRNRMAAEATDRINQRLRDIEQEREVLMTRKFGGPTPALLGGAGTTDELGPVTGMAPVRNQADVLRRQRELDAEAKHLRNELKQYTVGTTGQTVGGVGGALLGGGVGAMIGSPAGPAGMVVGGTIGSVLGAAGGAGLGTRLWDIPEARNALDISDEQAAKLIKDRMIESLLWDGAFVLVFGPGGRLLGKMRQGTRFGPALKQTAVESLNWDEYLKADAARRAKIIAGRAKQAPEGLATEASTALGVPTQVSGAEATRKLIEDIHKQSGGHIPTKGEMRGLVDVGERVARSQSPLPYFRNDQILAETAERIRATALDDLTKAGAYTGPEFGTAIGRVRDSARNTLRRVTAPVFERAASQGGFVDMKLPLEYIEETLAQDARALNQMLEPGERRALETMFEKLKATPRLPMDGAQDFISGNKAKLRGLASDGTRPSEFMGKVLGTLNDMVDKGYLEKLGQIDDGILRADLIRARKMYKDTMDGLYSDTMVMIAKKNPEDAGKALTLKGSVTEIRELRKAMAEAEKNAPRFFGQDFAAGREMSAELIKKERARIDAGLVKGFIEKHTQTLTDLSGKLRDPDFRLTLKELLTGPGVADPKLGRKVLAELDRTLAVMKLIKPELAPQPGRLGVPGMGGVGAGTAAATVTGDIRTAAPLVFLTAGLSRKLGTMVAKAMTTTDTGAFRIAQRALSLGKIAGRSAAAAEAFRGALAELDEWDRAHGGTGFDWGQPEQPVPMPEQPRERPGSRSKQPPEGQIGMRGTRG